MCPNANLFNYFWNLDRFSLFADGRLLLTIARFFCSPLCNPGEHETEEALSRTQLGILCDFICSQRTKQVWMCLEEEDCQEDFKTIVTAGLDAVTTKKEKDNSQYLVTPSTYIS